MIIKARNVPDECPLLVRYAVGGIYHQAAALADDGVTIPDDRSEAVLRERVRDFIYDCTRDGFNIGWTLSAHQTDDLIALLRSDDAQIIDIAVGGNGETTVQVTFEPAWPAMLDAPREAA